MRKSPREEIEGEGRGRNMEEGRRKRDSNAYIYSEGTVTRIIVLVA